ncbi:MAG: hypothetical protein ACK47C_17415 [Paracoccaceae bacterium]|jgi:hypothetical protein
MRSSNFRTRQALADLDRAAGGDPQGGDSSAAFDSAAPPDRLWSATACLLWQALMGRVKDPFLEDIWDQRRADLIAAPAPIRAALMNGFDRLRDLGLTGDHCKPRHEDLVTVPRTSVESALMAIAREMTDEEIDHVSRADYGTDVAQHRAALVALLSGPQVAYPPGEYWFPAEAVELVAHVPKATGYIPCMAIVLLDAVRDGDRMENAAFRLGRQWTDLNALPQRARDAFFAAFRYLYESGPCWSADLPESFTLPRVENIGPPPAKSDRRKR